MTSGLSIVAVLALCVIHFPSITSDVLKTDVSRWQMDYTSVLRDCDAYTDISGRYYSSKKCSSFCCGTCNNRYCCADPSRRLTNDRQFECAIEVLKKLSEAMNSRPSPSPLPLPLVLGILFLVALLLLIICCCVCPCCCLYKMCRKPTPVIATTTHTTVVTNTPRPYPQQPTVHVPSQPYQGNQYPPYQPLAAQPGFGAQPGPTTPYPGQGQAYVSSPPPTYQEATGPSYGPTGPSYGPTGPSYGPELMPYNQAGFMQGQPPYPMPPPAQPQLNATFATPDFLTQPAYNPDFVGPPPKTG